MTQMILDGFAENKQQFASSWNAFYESGFFSFFVYMQKKSSIKNLALGRLKTGGFPFPYKQPVQNCSKPVNIDKINPRSV